MRLFNTRSITCWTGTNTARNWLAVWANSQSSPGTMEGYKALSSAGSKTGHLDAKTRELIAIAVGVTTRCDGCIAVHTKAAGSGRDQGRNC